MNKLINGIIDFRKNVRPTRLETFKLLALGQSPDTLFITCSDSRVAPNWFASTDPGDLFVGRNVGNLVPPCGKEGHSTSDESEAAALEFALLSLSVKQVIVCGHSECGAMNALSRGREQVAAPNLKSWLRHGEGSLTQLKLGAALGSHLERHNQISQLNVLEQLGLMTYPVVSERLAKGTLELYGWWFDIKNADVYAYDPALGKFELIDEGYAAKK
jgi:carbonic anhydrase